MIRLIILVDRLSEIVNHRCFIDSKQRAINRSQLGGSTFRAKKAKSFPSRLLGSYASLMHLLHLDHSGEPSDPKQRHPTLAVVSCFERQTRWLSQKIDEIAARFNPADPFALELHANPMIVGHRGWRAHPVSASRRAVKDVPQVFAESHPSNRMFGICKDKRAATSSDILAELFAEVCSRFDRYLGRLHRQNDTQRGNGSTGIGHG